MGAFGSHVLSELGNRGRFDWLGTNGDATVCRTLSSWRCGSGLFSRHSLVSGLLVHAARAGTSGCIEAIVRPPGAVSKWFVTGRVRKD